MNKNRLIVAILGLGFISALNAQQPPATPQKPHKTPQQARMARLEDRTYDRLVDAIETQNRGEFYQIFADSFRGKASIPRDHINELINKAEQNNFTLGEAILKDYRESMQRNTQGR